MTTMTPGLCAEVTDALRMAGRQDLITRIAATAEKEALTSSEAAKLLGVSSANTVKNWLEGGCFPGAFQTEGGHWRFPRHEIEETKRRMEQLRDKNRRRDLSPPDNDDDCMPPLL